MIRVDVTYSLLRSKGVHVNTKSIGHALRTALENESEPCIANVGDASIYGRRYVDGTIVIDAVRKSDRK